MDNITSVITSLSYAAVLSGEPLRVLSLPSSLFRVNQTYGFQLTVTNWRGASATSDIISVYKSSQVCL